MKIGVLIDRLNVGGVEKIAIEQVRSLRKIGEDAYLVVLREKGVVNNAFPDLLKDLPVVYLDRRLPAFLRLSFSFPIFHFLSSFHFTYPLFLPFVIKKAEFDYLIVHGTYTSISAVAIKKIKKINFSAFIWDPSSYILERVYKEKLSKILYGVLRSVASRLDRFLINNMDNVLVGGPAHNKFIKKVNPEKQIVTIYPSVHPVAKPLKKDNYVLMATAWKRGKNPEYVFSILKKMPKIRIKMVGKWLDPTYKLEFETMIHQGKFDDQIDVVGEVSEDELSQYFAHAIVVLQTNDDRGFGMPALEAAGSATTFIVPVGQGVCDLFTDKEHGYFTKEKDTKVIVNLLKKVFEEKKGATEMGVKAWEKVKANYSWEKHASELKKIVLQETQSNH